MPALTPRQHPRLHRLVTALVAAAIVAVPFCAAPAAVAAAPTATLAISATPASVAVGDTVTATITATGVTDLYAYDLDLTFDPALLRIDASGATGPQGGFTTATAGNGTATVTHTRLGTSPGLSGAPLTLAVVTFTALGSGTATVALPTARLVSSTQDVTRLTPAASAVVRIAAPSAASPTPAPSVSASATAAAAPATAAPAAAATPDLAVTGLDAGLWLVAGALGVGVVAIGAVLIARRRQGARS